MDCIRECGLCPSDIPCLDTPSSATLYVYSNDGSELLASANLTGYDQGAISYTENSAYGRQNCVIRGYIYWGAYMEDLILDMAPYDGLSYSVGATTPDIPYETTLLDESSTADVTVYVVPKGGGGSTLDVTYNGSKIIDSEEVTPPVTVTYNGSTIASLNAGDTKTLDILGSDNKPKILATPIVIGGKTIPDVDALGRKWVLEHNLEVEVGG